MRKIVKITLVVIAVVLITNFLFGDGLEKQAKMSLKN